MFNDRLHAAELLAQRLMHYKGQSPLVLAIPRGAVPMGAALAQRLDGELDVVLVHKLCAPFQPELAIGAIDEGGHASLAPYAASVGATPAYITAEKNRQWQVLRERRLRYSPWRTSKALTNRTVIVLDDGMATGATMVAALTAVRRQQPARLVCAVPVASKEALELVRPLADELVCLLIPTRFQAVGQFYEVFTQVEDDEVAQCLQGPTQALNNCASPSTGAAASLAANKG